MIYYKTDEEVELLRAANMLVARTHAHLAKEIKPGVTSNFLNELAETLFMIIKQRQLLKDIMIFLQGAV